MSKKINFEELFPHNKQYQSFTEVTQILNYLLY